MQKCRHKFLTTALVTALVLGSIPADVVNAQAVDGDAVQTEAVGEAVVEEMTEIVEATEEIVEAAEEAANEILEETEAVDEETIETASIDEPMELASGENLAVNAANFPDERFRNYLLGKFDEDGNGYINPSDVTSISVMGMFGENINTLKGIEYFTELVYLECSYNNLTSLDVSKNTKLEELYCIYNNLTSLDVSKNTKLKILNCSFNNITSLDVSKNTKLVQLGCYSNNMTSLDVSGCISLGKLDCYENNLTSLDVSKNAELYYLACVSNNLSSLDVSKNTKLEDLYCYENNLTSLDVSKNTELQVLSCGFNNLSSLDVSKSTKLEQLYCYSNNLTSLDVSKNTKLETLTCFSNNLSSLDVSQNTNLRSLTIDCDKVDAIDLSNAKSFSYLTLRFDQLPIRGTLNLSKIKGCRIMEDMSAVSYELSAGSYSVVTDKGSITIHAMRIEGDDATAPGTFKTTGIYHAEQNRDGILAGLCTEGVDKSQVEYSWYVCKDDKNWILAQDWIKGNEWLSYAPKEYGDYVLVGKARYTNSDGEVEIKEANSYFSYHPEIKGMCQMPYTGEGGGYLIGIESYDNPGQAYQYEMLILDCTLLAEGKDAWVYTTNRCNVADGSAFWTVWQPQYGYYWTLFRVYDQEGNMIDETCYGFANAY